MARSAAAGVFASLEVPRFHHMTRVAAGSRLLRLHLIRASGYAKLRTIRGCTTRRRASGVTSILRRAELAGI